MNNEIWQSKTTKFTERTLEDKGLVYVCTIWKIEAPFGELYHVEGTGKGLQIITYYTGFDTKKMNSAYKKAWKDVCNIISSKEATE